ncbi:sigma-70 family RNA polymerase sigma factor [Kutzneria sp. CA-103260]|uniref:sigma-70 family RNA polymerase sigma factor n=1 Tax=Kutzneria sp. CA-103260 TaxID=2802641 RepID=UPI001BA93A0A|nr:sigma-70 family RNA polymerase sigma factor [Kutzneria sp. CA-103260]QUQ69909.1 RNA polymerase sigma factor domain-containing protein [Kutzneria sp. CA-103260]
MAELSRPASAGADDDQALLDRLRAGDDSAFGQLFSRHADAVRRFAMQQVRDATEADDLTAEAFFRVLQAVRRGNGPTDHVRTYLLTVARRVSWEWSARRRDVPVEDAELDRRAEPYTDNSSRLAESTLISQAFSSLPERWRTVLWQVEVEGERPAVVAPHFGLSANATAALARRARDGLRAAYLQAHLTEGLGATACQSVREKLGGYTAGTVKGLEGRRIRAHLRGCDQCKSLQGELREVCSALRAHAGVLVPLISLGATAAVAGHVAGSGFGAALVGKGALLATRVKLALTATSVAAVGVFGIAIGPWLSHAQPDAAPDHSDHQIVSTYCAPSPGQPTAGNGPTSGSIPTSAFASGSPASAKAKAAEGALAAFFGNRPGRVLTPPSQTGSATPPSGTPQTTVTQTSTSPTTPTGKVLDDPTSGTSGTSETSDTSVTVAVLRPTTTTAPTKSTPSTTTAPKKTSTTNTVTPTPSDPTPTATSTATSTTTPRKPQ